MTRQRRLGEAFVATGAYSNPEYCQTEAARLARVIRLLEQGCVQVIAPELLLERALAALPNPAPLVQRPGPKALCLNPV